MTAHARVDRDRGDVVAELDAGQTPRFVVSIQIRNDAGETTAEMTMTWALRPHRPTGG